MVKSSVSHKTTKFSFNIVNTVLKTVKTGFRIVQHAFNIADPFFYIVNTFEEIANTYSTTAKHAIEIAKPFMEIVDPCFIMIEYGAETAQPRTIFSDQNSCSQLPDPKLSYPLV
jgi:hypothetical protein